MQDKLATHPLCVVKAEDKRMPSAERAACDNAWRSRPLWHAVRDANGEWRPCLTRAAFQLLSGEDHDAAADSH